MKTNFALLAVYNRVLIPFDEFVTNEMGISINTANNQVAKGSFPVKISREGGRRFIHVDDAADWIESIRGVA